MLSRYGGLGPTGTYTTPEHGGVQCLCWTQAAHLTGKLWSGFILSSKLYSWWRNISQDSTSMRPGPEHATGNRASATPWEDYHSMQHACSEQPQDGMFIRGNHVGDRGRVGTRWDSVPVIQASCLSSLTARVAEVGLPAAPSPDLRNWPQCVWRDDGGRD